MLSHERPGLLYYAPLELILTSEYISCIPLDDMDDFPINFAVPAIGIIPVHFKFYNNPGPMALILNIQPAPIGATCL